MKTNIYNAIKVIKEGGIVVFPTDTAYGIGCRIDREDSVKRLFELRRRPSTQAVPVLVSSPEMAFEYIKDDEDINSLMSKFWPGGLTIVANSKMGKVHSLIRGGGETLGVRMPNKSEILEIIKEVEVPILGPSANFSGEKTPYSFKELNPELLLKVDFVLEGEIDVKEVSTVIDCSVKPWRILREGAVKVSIK